jgi:ParB family chromosome partitioning protein
MVGPGIAPPAASPVSHQNASSITSSVPSSDGARHEPRAGSNVVGDLSAGAAPRVHGEEITELPLDAIAENPYQTRLLFNSELLSELAHSIEAHGVLQPIVVRPAIDGKYALILGERRLRAARIAKLEKIPAIVRRVNDEQAAEMTVIENIQRQDLRCMEQAAAFSMLSRNFGLTQEEIGKKTGVSRETVSNYMRLLKLPFEVQQFLTNGELEFSHARELLNLLDPTMVVKIAEQAVKHHMSVVQIEKLVFETNVPLQRQADAIRRGARWVDPNVKAAQRELEEALGVRVRIRDRKGKGKIVIEYATIDDFDRVVEMLKGSRQ